MTRFQTKTKSVKFLKNLEKIPIFYYDTYIIGEVA